MKYVRCVLAEQRNGDRSEERPVPVIPTLSGSDRRDGLFLSANEIRDRSIGDLSRPSLSFGS